VATNPERSEEEKAADSTIDQELNDKNPTIDGDITADAADRYAESIRPSWVRTDRTQTVQKDTTALEQPSKNSPDAASVASQSVAGREDTDAELKLAAASITPVKKVRKKTLIWAGIVAACLLLITLSVVTQKKQKTSLWKSEKTATPADLQRLPKEAIDEARSGEKVESKLPAKTSTETSASTTVSPSDRVKEPLSEPEVVKDLTASSQVAEQPSSSPITEKPKQEAVESPKVHIRVTTVPVTAELTLDGSSVPNPFDRLLPKNGAHLFVARAYGYSKKYSRVSFDRDRKLSLRLQRKPRKSLVTRRRATKTASRQESTIAIPRKTAKPSKAPSSTKSSRKGFVSENPY